MPRGEVALTPLVFLTGPFYVDFFPHIARIIYLFYYRNGQQLLIFFLNQYHFNFAINLS